MTPKAIFAQVPAADGDVYRYEVRFAGHTTATGPPAGIVGSQRTSLVGHAHSQLLWRATALTGIKAQARIGYCFVTRKAAAEWIAEQLGLEVERPAAARIPSDPFKGLPS
jgi:hypothetical protein